MHTWAAAYPFRGAGLDVRTLRDTRRSRDGAGLQPDCDSLWNMRSRALGRAPSEVASLAAPGTRAAGPWGRPWLAAN